MVDKSIDFLRSRKTINFVPETAVVPKILDYQVPSGPDDGNNLAGVFNSNNADVLIGYFFGVCNAFYRFTGVTIPVGSVITTAYISALGGNVGAAGAKTRLWAEDTSNPTAPTSNSDLASRVKTTNFANWNGAGSAGVWSNSPSLAAIIQELVNSYDYSAGKSLQILQEDNGTSQAGSTVQDWLTYDSAASSAAKLHIEYN